MSDQSWGFISPEDVAKVFSFKRIDKEPPDSWQYSANRTNRTMYDIQAEGTARLWNLLDLEKIALLADEVGMGKTIQALAVCALLWRLNPDARILVLSPNHSVADNWVNEYKTFINSHLRHSDNLVRTGIGDHAVHEPFLCGNLSALEELVASKWCHFIIAKTSSLSTSTAGTDESWDARVLTAYENGLKLNRQFVDELGGRFDLLIIDEAQYYRKFHGDSLRVSTAKGLFGAKNPFNNREVESGTPLAERVLLMTATPNHTSNQDIQHIVRYFNAQLAKDDSQTILERIGVRRLRILAGKMKYQYRNEEDLECNFGDDVLGELFFALYQRKLVTEVAKNSTEKRSFTYGYLEGFESTSFEQIDNGGNKKTAVNREISDEIEDSSSDPNVKQQSEDFRRNADSELLNKLANDFKKLFRSDFPVHPKYDRITDRVITLREDYWHGERDDTNDKNLIFVRRIPSVRELAARTNNAYDKLFMKKIYKAWGDEAKKEIPTRQAYIAFTTSKIKSESEIEEVEIDLEGEEEEKTGDYTDTFEMNSQVIDLFRVKKDLRKELQRTHATNFRLRFTRENDPFSIFFQPAKDYKTETYSKIYKKKAGEQYRFLYQPSALYSRLNKDTDGETTRATIMQHLVKEFPKEEHEEMKIDTLWGLYYPLLNIEQQGILDDMDLYRKEGFASFLQKGILFASSAMIELYGWFIETQLSGVARGDLYSAFLDRVRQKLPDSLLLKIVIKAFTQFEIYAEKFCGLFDEIELIKEGWNIFNRQNPAYPCSGDTQNRQRLINAFNSPFFPNVLIATSVLQEGVNLQYNCRNVYHYGIAWTPGDNEQRVGRIDRLFSLVERNIKIGHSDPTLNIYYPYLNDSFDRDQVAEFIKKKYENEITLDKCYIPKFDKTISDTSAYSPYWKEYLRKPQEDVHVDDPYPTDNFQNVKSHQFRYTDMVKKYRTAENLEEDILEKIMYIVQERFGEESTVLKTIELRTQIALIDVVLNNNRHQPVVAELNFSSELSGLTNGTVYYLTFRTPITFDDSKERRDEILKIYERYRKDNPLVQLCYDSGRKSQFTIYMRTDLPLFVTEKRQESNLAVREIAYMFEQLVSFADFMEVKLFGDKQDISLLEVQEEERHETKRLRKWKNKDERIKLSKTTYILDTAKINKNKIRKEYKNLSAMQLTHHFQFVKFRETNNHLYLELPYPGADLDQEEEELLRRWFDFVYLRVVER